MTAFHPGDHVLISCITSCGKCDYCRSGMYSHCTTGGWILGNEIDGTQAEYVRIPHADTSLYRIPEGADEEALVMLSDILPTGFECGVLNGKVQPGDARRHRRRRADRACGAADGTVLFARRDHHDRSRRQPAAGGQPLRCDATINSADGKAAEDGDEADRRTRRRCGHRGGRRAGHLRACQDIVAPGGIIANIGVHGVKVDLHLERLWSQNITITTRLVDTVTTPMLLKTVQSRQARPEAAHHPPLHARPDP